MNSKKSKIPQKMILLSILVIITALALVDFYMLGFARRTFVFYTIEERLQTVEERNLRIAEQTHSAQEINITRYVEEAILGPISPDSLPLFPRETRLLTLLYRDGIVYADLSKEAAMPPPEASFLPGLPSHEALPGGDVLSNLKILHEGIVRNFPYVRDIRFFIAGKAAYTDNFR